MTSIAPPYHLPTNTSEASLKAPTLPPYTEHASASPRDEDIELASLSASITAPSYATSPASVAGPSSSSSSPSIFTPTKQLQIQTQGKTLLSFPTPQRPDPIPIFSVNAAGGLERPLYLSVRPAARSVLLPDARRRRGAGATNHDDIPVRAREGAVVVLGDPGRDPAISTGEGEEEGFEIPSRSIFSRAVLFSVPGLGTFGWRYASTKERASVDAENLLVCEVYVNQAETSTSAKHDNSGKKKEKEKEKGVPLRIAQLVRNETFRSPGTSRSSAGNGGRLMLDLAFFEEKRRERVEWLVVTTAVTMLKREVDRRRAQQIAVIGALAS